MPDAAPPAPTGPASPPPKFDKQPPIKMPGQRKAKAIGEPVDPPEPPPFSHDDVVELARLLSTKKGDNPDAAKFGIRNYERHMELATAILTAFHWLADRSKDSK